MSIGIDARLINRDRRGMGNALYNILIRVKKYYYGEIFLYFDRIIEEKLYNELIELGYNIIIIHQKNYFLWEQIWLPIHVRKDNIDVFWFPYNTSSLFINCCRIVTINDVMYLKNIKELPYSKNIYQILGRIYRKLNVKLTAIKANKIITISIAAKVDIMKEIKDIRTGNIEVIYLGCSKEKHEIINDFEWNEFKLNHGISTEYFFCLGATDPRKNTMYTIEVFNSFIKKNDIEDISLVICGIKNAENTIFYKKVVKLGIDKKVIFVKYVSDSLLNTLYYHSKIFLFLSYYEGFGLPILEAMAMGVPVITTKVTSMPEIAGNSAILTAYNDIDVTVNDIEKVFKNKKLYNTLVRLGNKRIKYFDWNTTAKKVSELFQNLEIVAKNK